MTKDARWLCTATGVGLILLGSCSREPRAGHYVTPHEILAACKLAALQNIHNENNDSDVENFFDACMASRGYERPNIPMCRVPNKPGYNYVAGTFDLGQNGLDGCYKPVSR